MNMLSASRSVEVASFFWSLDWHSLPHAVPISNHVCYMSRPWCIILFEHEVISSMLTIDSQHLVYSCGVANEKVNNFSCFVFNSYRVRISLLRRLLWSNFWFSSVPPDKFKDDWGPPSFSSGPPGKFRGCNPTAKSGLKYSSLSNLVLTMRDSKLWRRWCATVHSGGYNKRFKGIFCFFLRGRKLRHWENDDTLAVFPLAWPILLPWRLRHQVLSKHLSDYTAQQSSLFVIHSHVLCWPA